jgi:hypothetical protein
MNASPATADRPLRQTWLEVGGKALLRRDMINAAVQAKLGMAGRLTIRNNVR